jgi:hypothetical protein
MYLQYPPTLCIVHKPLFNMPRNHHVFVSLYKTHAVHTTRTCIVFPYLRSCVILQDVYVHTTGAYRKCIVFLYLYWMCINCVLNLFTLENDNNASHCLLLSTIVTAQNNMHNEMLFFIYWLCFEKLCNIIIVGSTQFLVPSMTTVTRPQDQLETLIPAKTHFLYTCSIHCICYTRQTQ